MGNWGYFAGRSPPHTTARGEGWVSKKRSNTLKGDSDKKCCDRTGFAERLGDFKMVVFFGMLLLMDKILHHQG